MKYLKIVVITFILIGFGGCTDFYMICSLNPFYLEKDIIRDDMVCGLWKVTPLKSPTGGSKDKSQGWKPYDISTTWKIQPGVKEGRTVMNHGNKEIIYPGANYFFVRLISDTTDDEVIAFKMVLFKVNHALYADFTPVANATLNESRMATEGYVSVHTLARVFYDEKHLKFSWLGADYMKSMIEDKRVRVKYRWIEGIRRLVLTGSSEELTGMIERYAGEHRFVDWEVQKSMLMLSRLNRKKK